MRMIDQAGTDRIKEIRASQGVSLFLARELYFKEVRKDKIEALKRDIGLVIDPYVRKALNGIVDLL